MEIDQNLVERYAAVQVPRYTSYPTAPHFNSSVTGDTVSKWMNALHETDRISLYAHIPFCDTLCWFCGCHTKQTLRYDPIAEYLKVLKQEIALVADQLVHRPAVGHLHFGGGSPTILSADDIDDLFATLRTNFRFAADAEIAIEIDPRDITPDKIDALIRGGLNRASIGVQDFDPVVQKAINRFQSEALTAGLVEELRRKGIGSVNLDILYGLPHQTEETLARTIDAVVAMRPDRIALFGYAHVPWMKTHQKMIDEAALPGINARFGQAMFAASRLQEAGYVRVGFDHFALPSDSLAIAAEDGTLRRNFQGYTTDDCDALIGLGASSVSEYPQGYAQNIVSTGHYMATVKNGRIPTEKGFTLRSEDRIRRAFIERLLCDFKVDTRDFVFEHGETSACLASYASMIAGNDLDDLVRYEGGIFSVTERGRPFVRTIAAKFDAYLGRNEARHSLSV